MAHSLWPPAVPASESVLLAVSACCNFPSPEPDDFGPEFQVK